MRQPERILCVLGMHRSGTSCLTGSLQQGGLFLGKHHTWNEYNRKGNRENQDIVDLHENIFKANGVSWHYPVRCSSWYERLFKPQLKWRNSDYEQARKILDDYADQPIWGFKDPRALMLLDGWLKVAPHMEFVGIYRHPMAVAQSLHNREALKLEIAHGLELWLQYNTALFRQFRKTPFPLLSFDWSEEKFHDKLEQLHKQLGLAALPEGQRFYTAELHNEKITTAALPPKVQALYEKFQEIEY
ncbi:MAG: sulfotransferase family protein [Pseudomonadales bacterium]|nr:sulfotransferase family protein [Pseudomonadales bacterium]